MWWPGPGLKSRRLGCWEIATILLAACRKRRPKGGCWTSVAQETAQSVKWDVLLDYWVRCESRASLRDLTWLWLSHTNSVPGIVRILSRMRRAQKEQIVHVTVNTTRAFRSLYYIRREFENEWQQKKNFLKFVYIKSRPAPPTNKRYRGLKIWEPLPVERTTAGFFSFQKLYCVISAGHDRFL